MTKEQKQVKEWMEKFGQKCPDKPTEAASLELRKLRARLILEEAFETINEGLGLEITTPLSLSVEIDDVDFYDDVSNDKGVNLVELADGLADLHYVAYCGTASSFGIDMEPIFQEVHRSNESKLWPYSLVIRDGDDINQKNYSVDSVTLNTAIVKNKQGKVIKPETYSPPNIKEIIEEQCTSN